MERLVLLAFFYKKKDTTSKLIVSDQPWGRFDTTGTTPLLSQNSSIG
ncbi:MAG: hypothetical protein LBP53_02525 [Candidatus Peribacteria bacterium]|nr:hypothetical protein [Candidatus Peribacteria bacterium]